MRDNGEIFVRNACSVYLQIELIYFTLILLVSQKTLTLFFYQICGRMSSHTDGLQCHPCGRLTGGRQTEGRTCRIVSKIKRRSRSLWTSTLTVRGAHVCDDDDDDDADYGSRIRYLIVIFSGVWIF